MGGVFNPINFAVYHYAGNNPIKYTDPSGKDIRNNTDQYILAKLEDAKNGSDFVILKPQDTYTGKLDGAILSDGTYIKVTDHAGIPTTPNFSVENKKGDEKLKFDSPWDGFVNALGDFFKGFSKDKKGDNSGVYPNEGNGHPVSGWKDIVDGEVTKGILKGTSQDALKASYKDQKNKTDQQLKEAKTNDQGQNNQASQNKGDK